MKIIQYKEILIILLLSIISIFSTINTYPVLDRDEARYAQASKQMIESNDYKEIKFQEEYRSKKPPGIYWLHSVSVNTLSNIQSIINPSGIEKNKNIWKYRIISSLAALASLFTMFYYGSRFLGKKIAFNSSLILGGALLFNIEAHIAKTDSVLLLLCLLTFFLLHKYYTKKVGLNFNYNFFLLWGTISLGILVKGPILPIIFLLCISCLYIIDRKFNWILDMKPILGVLFVALFTSLWFMILPSEQKNSFLLDSFVNDFFKKIISVQENHGGIIGLNFIFIWFLFFPFSIFLIPIIHYSYKNFKNTHIKFLLAWICPYFLILEFIPTKLPHYALPVYPALAILLSVMMSNFNKNKVFFYSIYAKIGYFLFAIVTVVLNLGLWKAMMLFSSTSKVHIISISILLTMLLALTSYLLKKQKFRLIIPYLLSVSVIYSFLIFTYYLPNLDKIWISKKIKEIIFTDNQNYKASNVASVGFNEPSLVFELGTKLQILKNLEFDTVQKANFTYIIVSEDYNKKLNLFKKGMKNNYTLLANFSGFNSAKGKWTNINIYKKISNRGK